MKLQLIFITGMDSSRTKPDLIPETSAQEEKDEERNWRSVVIMGLERKIDLKVIEPYKKVILLHFIDPLKCNAFVMIDWFMCIGTFAWWLPRQRLPNSCHCV